MKKTLFIISLFLAYLSTYSQSFFEGKMKILYEAKGEVVDFVYFLSPTQTAVEMNFQVKAKPYKAWTFCDKEKKNLVLIGESPEGKKETKTYPLSTLNSQFRPLSPTLNYATGKEKQTFLGYACINYTFRFDDYQVVSVIAPTLLTNRSDLTHYLKDEVVLQILEKENIAGFPLKTTFYDKEGKIISSWEVKEMTFQKLTSQDFSF